MSRSNRKVHFPLISFHLSRNGFGASSATYNMTVINTASDLPLSEPSPTNGHDGSGMGGTPLFHEQQDWWSAIHDHHSDASDRPGMSHGVNAADWGEALWHDATGGPSSADWQFGRAEIAQANALPGTNVGSTQKALFSVVSDVGWAGVGGAVAPVVNGHPGALLEHDRVASFDLSHAAHGGAFLL